MADQYLTIAKIADDVAFRARAAACAATQTVPDPAAVGERSRAHAGGVAGFRGRVGLRS